MATCDRSADDEVQKLLDLIDQAMESGAWRNPDDCLMWCLLQKYGPENALDGRTLAGILPILRECYRLHRFQKYGYVTHSPGEMTGDGLPVYHAKRCES